MADSLGAVLLQVAELAAAMTAYAGYLILVSGIALVTSRMARTKGRTSAWVWSAFLLGLLGLVPLLILVFLPSRTPRAPS